MTDPAIRKGGNKMEELLTHKANRTVLEASGPQPRKKKEHFFN